MGDPIITCRGCGNEMCCGWAVARIDALTEAMRQVKAWLEAGADPTEEYTAGGIESIVDDALAADAGGGDDEA